MRKIVYGLLATVMVALVGCVTINVYFPEAAAQKAADQFIGTVLDNAGKPAPRTDTPPPAKPAPPSAMLLNLLVPAAYAGDAPNIRIQNATTEAIRQRMQSRFQGGLGDLFKSGAVGFTHDGMVAVRDASKVPLSQRAQVNAIVAEENRDRAALYREVASANGHPEWQAQIRATFAKGWIERAPAGWYYQDAAGAWKRK
ncbi:YdbL family protein [Dyella sp. KRB-257]|uniref:YdbL family protein n=1 Tax=Dyella sp. KRB-257 TaxID=3400915 RepID=UPI003C1059C1